MRIGIKILIGTLLLALCATGYSREPQDGDVVVFGGSGRLGSEIVKALLAKDYKVSVFVRASSSRKRLEGLPVAYLVGDVLDYDSVESALGQANFSVVVDALGRGSQPPEFYKTSGENIANAAAQTGVKQIILHGSVGAGNSRAVLGRNADRFKRVMDAKTAAEEAVIQSEVSYTIIRNFAIGRHGLPATGAAILLEDPSSFGPIRRADLALLTVDCVLKSACSNKIFHALDPSLMENPPER